MFEKCHTYVLVVLCVLVLVVCCVPAGAVGFTLAPQWTVTAFSDPTNLAPGGRGVYVVRVQNTGGAPSGGEVTVADVLPVGLKAAGVVSGKYNETQATEVSCVGLTCTYAGVVGIDNILEFEVPVEVEAGVRDGSSVTNAVTVSGGGAPEASRETPTLVSAASAGFGIARGSSAAAFSNDQAGGHPDVTTVFALNSSGNGGAAGNVSETGGSLPPGFVGDLADTPKCPISGFSEEGDGALHCSLSTVVGTVTIYLGFGTRSVGPLVRPLMNLTTNPGEISKLGFSFLRYGIQGTVTLAPGDYGVHLNFEKLSDSSVVIRGSSLTVWGVPSEPSHDLMRGSRLPGTRLLFLRERNKGTLEWDRTQ